MADEFFRPYFSDRASGRRARSFPGFWYNVMVGGTNCSRSTSSRANWIEFWGSGASMWWMPTTKEFGPRGALRRLGVAREARDPFRCLQDVSPEAALHGLADRQPRQHNAQTCRQRQRVRQRRTGARRHRQNADFRILPIDAGIKYKGFFLQTEIYNRWLDGFMPTDRCRSAAIHDTGFYRAEARFTRSSRSSRSTARRRRSSVTRAAGFSHSSEYGRWRELLSDRHAEPSAEHAGLSMSTARPSAAHSVTTSAARRARRMPMSFSVFF